VAYGYAVPVLSLCQIETIGFGSLDGVHCFDFEDILLTMRYAHTLYKLI
jgi:hypothetical protein